MFHDFHVRKGVIWLYGWTGEQVENGECRLRGFVPVNKISHVHCDWDYDTIRIFVDGDGAPAFTVSFKKYDDAGATMARCIETIEDALEATYGSSTDN